MPMQTGGLPADGETTHHPAGQPESCTACSAALIAGDRFCACCGTPVRQTCPACGEPLQHVVAIYCPHCGRKLPG